MGVQAIKHAALLREWSSKIAECRSSGMPVKAWCAEQGIHIKTYYYWEKRFVTESTQQLRPPVSAQAGMLMKVNPDVLPDEDMNVISSNITIRRGESIITLPAGSSVDAVEISNNQVENAIRPIVVGRKNWLFCDTQAGASASATIFTLLETAKSNGLNPETYLFHLLDVLPERFAEDSQTKVDDLMPWSKEMQSRFRD